MIAFRLTDRSKEDDGKEVSDRLDASHDLCCDHVTLWGQQSSSQETTELHGNIQHLSYLQHESARKEPAQTHNGLDKNMKYIISE